MQNVSTQIIFQDEPYLQRNGTILEPPYMPPLPGSVWRVGISPWARLRPDCFNKTKNCHVGVELEILGIIATLLNVTFNFTVSTSPGCGYRTSDGNWTGLMGMLTSGQIDITGNLCTADSWRLEANFTKSSQPVVRYRQSFLVRYPQPAFEFSISAPFSSSLWYLLFSSVFIYAILDAVLKKLLMNQKILYTLKECLISILHTTAGMDAKVEKHKRMWFVLTCYISFFAMVYTTYVKGALITPVTLERPFRDTIELADKLHNGEYKFLDYHDKDKIAYPRCYAETCKKIADALNIHDYYYLKPETAEGTTNRLLEEIIKNENLVMAKGRYWINNYLDQFRNRSELWLMDDELAGEEWSVYFFRNDFELATLFDRALTLLGDWKSNVDSRYLGLSKMTYDKNFVKGNIPEKAVMVIEDMQGPITCYVIGVGLATAIFLLESLKAKTNGIKKSKRNKYSFDDRKKLTL